MIKEHINGIGIHYNMYILYRLDNRGTSIYVTPAYSRTSVVSQCICSGYVAKKMEECKAKVTS